MSWLNQFLQNYPRQTSHLVQNCLPLLLLWQCCPTLGLEVTCTSLSVSPWRLNPASNTTHINDLLFLKCLRDPTVYNTWSSSQKEWTYSLCTDHVSNCLIKSVNLDENKINIVSLQLIHKLPLSKLKGYHHSYFQLSAPKNPNIEWIIEEKAYCRF